MASSRILRVLLLKEGSDNGWVAQGLEIDIAAQGASIKEALNNFTEVFAGQVASDLANQREPLVSKKQAPPWYLQALKHAEPLKFDSVKSPQERATQTRIPAYIGGSLGSIIAGRSACLSRLRDSLHLRSSAIISSR